MGEVIRVKRGQNKKEMLKKGPRYSTDRRKGSIAIYPQLKRVGKACVETNVDNFLEYLHKNELQIVNALADLTVGWPGDINIRDYRFDKSDTIGRAIQDKFSELIYDAKTGTNGYDFSYIRRFKVSMKMQQKIFQERLIHSKLCSYGAPDTLVLRNMMGSTEGHEPRKEDYFDYLWAIQARYNDQTGFARIQIAAVTFEDVIPHIKKGKDQVKCKLFNEHWEKGYLSRVYRFRVPNYGPEFELLKNERYDKLRTQMALEMAETGHSCLEPVGIQKNLWED